jgi:hypothetical protein
MNPLRDFSTNEILGATKLNRQKSMVNRNRPVLSAGVTRTVEGTHFLIPRRGAIAGEIVHHRFRPTRNGKQVDIAEGSWVRNGVRVTDADGTAALGSQAQPYIVATIDDEHNPTTLTLTDEAAVPAAAAWILKRLICTIEYTAGGSINRIIRNQLSDIVDERLVVVRRWYKYGGAYPGVENTDYTVADTRPGAGDFAMQPGAREYQLTSFSGYNHIDSYLQECIAV